MVSPSKPQSALFDRFYIILFKFLFIRLISICSVHLINNFASINLIMNINLNIEKKLSWPGFDITLLISANYLQFL